MKLRIVAWVLAVIVILICLLPIPRQQRDGGTTVYEPIVPVYTVHKYHRIGVEPNEIIKGYSVCIFGAQIYENTYSVFDDGE